MIRSPSSDRPTESAAGSRPLEVLLAGSPVQWAHRTFDGTQLRCSRGDAALHVGAAAVDAASDEVHRTPLDELGAGDNTRVQIAERSTEPVRLSPTLLTHANRGAARWGRRIYDGPAEADELGVTAHRGAGSSARLGPCRNRHSGLGLSEGHGTHLSQPQLVEHVLGDTSRRNAVIVDLAEAPGM